MRSITSHQSIPKKPPKKVTNRTTVRCSVVFYLVPIKKLRILHVVCRRSTIPNSDELTHSSTRGRAAPSSAADKCAQNKIAVGPSLPFPSFLSGSIFGRSSVLFCCGTLFEACHRPSSCLHRLCRTLRLRSYSKHKMKRTKSPKAFVSPAAMSPANLPIPAVLSSSILMKTR